MKKEYRNSQRTRRMIRSAFVELVAEKKSLSEITVAELAERADIAKSTFYNHYDDIYGVADEMLREILEGLNSIIDAMEASKNNDYRLHIKSIFAFIKENAGIYSKIASSPDSIFFIDRIKHLISKRVFANINSPSLSQNKTERQVQITFFAHACVDTMVDYFKGNIDMTFDALENTVMAILDKMMT